MKRTIPILILSIVYGLLLVAASAAPMPPTTMPAYPSVPAPKTTRTVYVSSTQPTKTLAAAFKLGDGSNIFLRAGETYTVNGLNVPSNLIIQRYGNGSDPLLQYDGGKNGFAFRLVGHDVLVQDIECAAPPDTTPKFWRVNGTNITFAFVHGTKGLDTMFMVGEAAPKYAPSARNVRILSCSTSPGAVAEYTVALFSDGNKGSVSAYDTVIRDCTFHGTLLQHTIRTHAFDGLWILNNDLESGISSSGKVLCTINLRDGIHAYVVGNRCTGPGSVIIGPLDQSPNNTLEDVYFAGNTITGQDFTYIEPGVSGLMFVGNTILPRRNTPVEIHGKSATHAASSGIIAGNVVSEINGGIRGDTGGFFVFGNVVK